jgi:hypothetical protein
LLNNIIEVYTNPQGVESYSKNKGIGKSYRFNQNLLENISKSNIKDLNHIIFVAPDKNRDVAPEIEMLPPTVAPDYIDVAPKMEGLKFDQSVYKWINDYKIDKNDLKINQEIVDDYVDIVMETTTLRYSKENALSLSKELGMDLIQYKSKKCYLEKQEDFIKRKTNDFKIIFKRSVFDIENGIYRSSRNETNNRLDYNLTNMKSELIEFLRYNGERLTELDISNAQFSILSHIEKNIDQKFKDLSQSGDLYSYIETQLNLEPGEGKMMMFRVAFDKRKKDQDSIRELFPMTMKFVDQYKGENGYKKFSNLLQRTESSIMIDGLFRILNSKGLVTFPKHDAILCLESEVDIIKNEMGVKY